MSTRNWVARVLCCLLMVLVSSVSAAPPGEKQKGQAPAAADQGPLPGPVQATVNRRFPDAKVLGFEHQVEDQRHLYFVDLEVNKKEITMLASGRGQYLGVVEEDNADDSGDVFIEFDSAPQPVKNAIEKHFDKEPIDSLFMEVDEEKFFYCAEKTKAGVTRWLSFTPQGILTEDETEVSLKDLPAEVTAGIRKSRPRATLQSASLVKASGPPPETHYSVDIVDGKEELTLTVTPGGEVQSAEPSDDGIDRS